MATSFPTNTRRKAAAHGYHSSKSKALVAAGVAGGIAVAGVGAVLLSNKGSTPPGVVKPGAPTDLEATGVTATGCMLSCTPPAVGTLPFTYVWFENGKQIATTSGPTTPVTGLKAKTSYSFTCAAMNAAGTGPRAAKISVKTT